MTKIDPSQLPRTVLETEFDKLRRRENLYEAAERAANIGQYEWDYERDRLVSCSDEYARIFGMRVDEVMQAHGSWDKVIAQVHADDRQRYLEASDGTTAHHHLDIEYRIVLANGDIRHLREIGVNIVDNTDKKTGSFGIVQDVTRRTLHSYEIEQRDDLARQAEMLTNIGHYIFNEQTQTFIYISEGFARIHGTDVETHMSAKQSFEDDLEEVVEADRERVAAAYRNYIETGDDLEIEYRIVRADGEERWLRESNQAKTMVNGKVLQTLGVLQDVTRQKEIEKELMYKSTLAHQAEVITEIGHFLYDEVNEKFLVVSPGLAAIYGVDNDYLLNKINTEEEDMTFVHEEDREALMKVYYGEDTGDRWEAEYRMIRPGGEIRWVKEIGKSHVINDGIEEQTIGVVQDITERKQAEQAVLDAKDNLEREVVERTSQLATTIRHLELEVKERKRVSAELQFLANHDALTGLPTLRLCKDRIQQALAEARRSDQLCALMFMDLDGFKQVNDLHGHEAGDQVLKVTADRVMAEIRDTDTAARIGGDEFMVVLTGLPDVQIIKSIAKSLISQIGQPIHIETVSVTVGASIGIALYPENGTDMEDLIKAADKAMYEVKNLGKNDFGFAGYKSGRELGSTAVPDSAS